MSILTSTQQESIERFIEHGENDDGLKIMKAVRLALVMAGEYDGCLLKVSNESDKQLIVSILEETNLPYKYEQVGPIHRFFIAKSQTHMEKYSIEGDEDRGLFFGYPEESIDYFESIEDSSEFTEELDSSDELPSSKEFYNRTELIRYIPAPTPESIERAMQREEHYREILSEMSIDWSEVSEYNF